MPVVTVEWLEGRNPQQKARLSQAMTQAFAECVGVAKEQVWIIFKDVKRSDWAMAGQLVEPPTPGS
ncbi:MAG: tautomerase family protein [Candidatus Omnitrophica bacterium]|nr:tautomerase family protein [Candidatus Omnitrophota bacterium]